MTAMTPRLLLRKIKKIRVTNEEEDLHNGYFSPAFAEKLSSDADFALICVKNRMSASFLVDMPCVRAAHNA
jgi:hypothetical protein